MNGRAIGRWSIVAAWLLLTSVRAAAAAPDPLREAGPWQFLGVVEMRLAQDLYRITLFDNDELLAEQVVAGTTRRLLAVQPSKRELYFGLSEVELSPGKNPFAFFDLSIARPCRRWRGSSRKDRRACRIKPSRGRASRTGGATCSWRVATPRTGSSST